MRGIDQYRHSRKFRHGGVQKFEVFAAQFNRQVRQPGDVAARTRETCNETAGDGVAHPGHDHRHGRSCLPGRFYSEGGDGQNHVGLCTQQVCYERGKFFDIATGEARIDQQIGAFGAAKIAKPFFENLDLLA